MAENSKAIEITNVHTHVFTLKHVPLRLRFLIFVTRPIQWLLLIFRVRNNFIDRAAKLLAIGSRNTQSDIFEILRAHYPAKSKFVLLAMDMQYMGGGPLREPYGVQINELAEIKKAWPNTAYPFFFVDPRRPGVFDMMRKSIEEDGFQGIKIYPPMGYFPFPFPYSVDGEQKGNKHKSEAKEIVLKEVYEYAQANNIPVLTHVTRGGVHGYKRAYTRHPVTGLDIERTREAQAFHFSHPKNYYYLLEQFPDLKICLGHFGGHSDWKDQLIKPLQPMDSTKISDSGIFQIVAQDENYVDPVWNPTAQEVQENTWVNTIRHLLMDSRYPRVYVDISYNAYTMETLSYLKLLVQDSKFNKRILFGTDFYVVRLRRSEKEFSIGMRAFLGEENFRLIADENPRTFLNLT